jgi:hypothetical protein
MQMNIRHVHAGLEDTLLMCGLDCSQSMGPESSRKVLVELMLIIAEATVDPSLHVVVLFCILFHHFKLTY